MKKESNERRLLDNDQPTLFLSHTRDGSGFSFSVSSALKRSSSSIHGIKECEK